MAAVQCFCPLTCCQVTIHIFKQSQYRDSQKISLDLHNILTHFYFCFQMKWTWKDIFLAHMLPQLSMKIKIWKILKLLNYFIVLPKSNNKQMSALEYRLWGVSIVLSTTAGHQKQCRCEPSLQETGKGPAHSTPWIPQTPSDKGQNSLLCRKMILYCPEGTK